MALFRNDVDINFIELRDALFYCTEICINVLHIGNAIQCSVFCIKVTKNILHFFIIHFSTYCIVN